MNKNKILSLAIGLSIVIGGTLGVMALTNNNKQVPTTGHSSMTMTEMNKQLEKLSGDEFDKAFIEMMIVHHEGAVDMANLASTRAKHDEIKTLSKGIISAQTDEISKMQQWQTDWGYMSNDSSIPSMNH